MSRRPHCAGERGYTLLPLLAFVGIAATTLVYVWAAAGDPLAEREQRTAAALATARDALIGRAASDNNRPGSLPCPDVDNDGAVDGVAGNCTSYFGRLPWRTLGLPDVRDGWGERLWYALSSPYRDNAAGGPLNSDTPGTFTVRDASGAVLSGSVPALLIAPGPVLGSQSREAGNQSLAAMYLEGENANGDGVYVSALPSSAFNDRLLAITREDLFRPVVARVAKEAYAGLESYRTAHGYYPPANPYGAGAPAYACDPATLQGRVAMTITAAGTGCTAHAAWNGELPDWFFDNNWHLVTHYAVAAACADASGSSQGACTLSAGAQPLGLAGLSGAVRMLVVVSGPARGAQSRPCDAPAQCLDDGPNTDGDRQYVKPTAWPASNDRMAASCASAAPCAVMP